MKIEMHATYTYTKKEKSLVEEERSMQ